MLAFFNHFYVIQCAETEHLISLFDVYQIEGTTEIPELRSRLLKIIHQNNFEVSLHGICNSSLEDDTITILRSLNQGRRKAIKVSVLNF